jgi:hypothetical protein
MRLSNSVIFLTPCILETLEKRMRSAFIWMATFLSLLTFYIHTFIGGPRVAGPLLKNLDLPKASKWLNYYCWHVVTIYLVFMTGGFAFVALHPARPDLAVFLSILNFFLSILSAFVARKGGINPIYFPSTTLFALVSGCGFLWIFST